MENKNKQQDSKVAYTSYILLGVLALIITATINNLVLKFF
jgi:hypothetical protein